MSLALGQVVGGRFSIREERGADLFGRVFTARDQRSARDVSIRLVDRTLFPTPEAVETLRQECKRASKVRHAGILATYGLGKAGDHIFIAAEASEGITLWEAYARRQSRPAFSLRAVNHIVTHLAQAVASLPDDVPHGLLAPATVVISESGRVQLAELGLCSALIRSGGLSRAPDELVAFAAPEVRGGASPTRATDVYGIGSLSHFLLTGTAPGPTSPAPSTLHPEATRALDEVITACLAPTEQARPNNLDSVRDAFGRSMRAPRRDPSIEIDISMSEPPPASPSIPVEVRSSYAPAFEGAFAATADAGPTAKLPTVSGDDELADYLAKVTENDAHRWMVVKNGIDHGPFSGQDLVQKIVSAEVLAEHDLFNTETGQRCKVGEVEQFVPFLEQQKLRLAERAEQEALQRSEVVEKRSNLTKVALLSGVGLAVVVGVAFFIMHLTADDQQSRRAELADLYESGEVEIEGSAGILQAPAPRKGGRRRGKGGGGFGTYEDAMNQAVDLGDATGGGSMSQLTGAQVSSIMNRNLNSMFSCVGQELRSNGALGKVTIDLAIAGSGQVLGASVRPGSAGFQNCIQGKVRRIKFPSFGAPRMGARYSFDTSQ